MTLRVVRPGVSRLVRVPSDTRLGDLHRVLQVAMGWQDSHSHELEVAGQRYGVPEWDEDTLRDEADVRLLDVAHGVGDHFRYTYDFGDSWEHELVVRDVRRLGREESAYGVLGGGGACPAEDVGGAVGYADFLAALAQADPAERDNCSTGWAAVGRRRVRVSAADARMRSNLFG